MSGLTEFLSPVAEGWVMTLFHSLWQGALIAGLVYLVLWMFSVRDPKIRYGVGLAGLAVFVLSVAITFFQVMPEPQSAIAADAGQVTLVQVVTEGIAATETGWNVLSFIRANMPFILKLWAVGAILLLFRIIGGYQYMRRVIRKGEENVPENWMRMIDRIAGRLDIRKPIRVLHSMHVDMPMVFGHVKPVLLLPVSLLSGMTSDQLEAIFAHELAHIRRHDYLINIAQQVLESLFFFNPFIWILSSHLRTEREKCCDDLAMEICHNERQYVEALSTLELYRVHSPSGAMMLLGKKGELLHRIRRLTDPSYGEIGSSKWVLMIVLSASFFLFSYFTESREEPVEAETAVTQQPLVARIPYTYAFVQDTVPPAGEAEEQEVSQEVEEIIEEEISEDGRVRVYRYKTAPQGGSYYFRTHSGDSDSVMVFPFEGEGNFTFVMPDTDIDFDFDVRPYLADGNFNYFFRTDTIPPMRFNDSIMSEEDREAMRKAQEELQRAQELMQEEHERIREIMEKYREEYPQAMREYQRAMTELQRNMNHNRFELRVDGRPQVIELQRVLRDQQRLSEEQRKEVEKQLRKVEKELSSEEFVRVQRDMERAQREIERAQHRILVNPPQIRSHVVTVPSRPFFDRNKMESFEAQVEDMLRRDDYLNNDDKLKKIEVTRDYFKYNGKKVKGGDFQRYLEAYESRFGTLDGKINIQLED